MNRRFPDIVRLFDSLSAPATDVGLGRFCAQPVPGFPACAVAKDTSGHPALLIQADNAQPGIPAPLALEHLSVIHLVTCRVQGPATGESERTLSVLRCTEADRAFHEFFLRSLHPVIASLPRNPSRQQISDAIERLVNLFRRLTETPRKTVAGLWAELFVIASASDPATLLACWHSAPEEKFDFVSGAERIEVKASSGGLRVHHFSLEQIRPPAGAQAVVASVMLERAEGGSSIADLIDAIRQRVADPELLIRLDAVVAQAIGLDWRSMQRTSFDRQLAAASLRFLDASGIPSVPLPLPPEVSDVRFRVDLSSHDLPLPAQLIERAQLFRAAFPARPSAR